MDLSNKLDKRLIGQRPDLVRLSTSTWVFSSELLKMRAGIQMDERSTKSIRFKPRSRLSGLLYRNKDLVNLPARGKRWQPE